MKPRILNLLLLLTSLIGYLEWGGNNHSFLFEIELEIIIKLFSRPFDVIHPLIVIPLIGQILLLATIIQRSPSNVLTYSGLAGLGLIFGFLFFIGIFIFNLKVVASTLPFLTMAIITLRNSTFGKSANS
ncbi:MAG: hypothetical protein IPL22_14775 [Bacteroidetes bacterium]|nr:hypothetical protein [Bacteroidota bacterium]